ncbi:MAG: nitrous oxide reductase family maturation protein NosD [Candidatus Hermodarchaeota archaeon]
MNSTKKITIILVTLTFLSLLINRVNLNSKPTKVEMFTNFKEQIEKVPKSSGYWNLTGSPIIINGAGANNWTWFENQVWYGGGDGTLENPYIIENITIDGQSLGNCIEIRDSDDYFIIRNCTLYNSGSASSAHGGINLYGVRNGILIENNCSLNSNGILLENSRNNIVSNNTTYINNNNGILLSHSNYNTIFGNSIANNSYEGIKLSESSYNNLSKNVGVYNGGSGIYLEYSSFNIISVNNVSNNTIGLRLYQSNYNNIFDNDVCDNFDPIEEGEECEGNEFRNNKCFSPEDGSPPIEIIVIVMISIIFVMLLTGLMVLKRKRAREKLSIKEDKQDGLVSKSNMEFRQVEADFKKEKHICIVDRGKIVGAMYICPNCETYYCIKCANALKNKGEPCWACNNEIEL